MVGLRRGDLLVWAAVVVGAGCSSGRAASDGAASDGPHGPLVDADPSTAMGFCLSYVAFVADYGSRCEGLPFEAELRVFSDPVVCERFVASIQAGRLGFNPSAAATCAAALASSTACDGSAMPMPLAGCDQALTPLVPLGGTCASFYLLLATNECIGDAYCKEGANYACTGVCTARVPLGASCDFLSDIRCTSAATCDSSSKVCVVPPAPTAPNQPCGAAGQASCQEGYYCDTSATDGGTSGVCHAQRTSGACTVNAPCASGAHCVGASGAKTCALYKRAGESCTPGWAECDPLGYCGSDGKCTDSWVAVGNPCGAIGGESIPCEIGAYCEAALLSSGVCQTRKQAGDACTGVAVDECEGNNGHCDSATGKCVTCPP